MNSCTTQIGFANVGANVGRILVNCWEFQVPVTIEDVAKRSGVSIRTVSRVINERPDVAEATRLRVQTVIEELGYRPNTLARSMITGQTMTIGVVLPDIANPFFGRAIRGCEDFLNRAGYSILLCNTDEDLAKEQEYLALLLDRRVDGVIIWGSRGECDTLEAMLGAEVPVVTVDCQSFYGNVVNINVQNHEGARIATNHLIESGHTEIGFLAGPATRLTATRRLRGFQSAMSDAGLIANVAPLFGEAVPSVLQGYEGAVQLLTSAKRPTALFAYNDLMAVGALLAARYLDLSVPDDVAIVGFDDILMAALMDPPLTTIRIPQYELGRLTGESVLQLLAVGSSSPESIEFPVELRVRGSSVRNLPSTQDRQSMVEDIIAALAHNTPAQTSIRDI